uniref:Calmodulin-binding domain-containing protein n=1 Tax=Kalanchoe fedtschenkoi TaxID=63787 RepID=A0A7N0R8K4_KALFE
MSTKPKESVAGKEKRGVSPVGSSSTTAERRRSLRPSTAPATDHGKAPAASTATGEQPRKHVPNYLRPTISSKPDAAKHIAKKHGHDDSHKPTPAVVRRRSFDRPVPASQVQKTMQSSTARVLSPLSPKHSATVARPASSSASERVSKVVKAVKSQPPLLKAKSMPRTSSASASSGVKKEVKTSNLKKAAPPKEEEPVPAPNTVEADAEDQESLDLDVEEELAKMESPVDLPPERHFPEDKEQVDEENHSPKEHVDANEEKLDSSNITSSQDCQDKHEQTAEPVAETTENVNVSDEETQVIHQSHHTDESEHQNNQAVSEAPAEDDIDTQEAEKEEEREKETEAEAQNEKETEAEQISVPVKLTVKTTPDEKDEVAEAGDQVQETSEEGNDMQKSKGEDNNEEEYKADEEEKPANSEAENIVVHKLQVGGPKPKKESPGYNDVIEETASKLVEKRVNKVRALAGAFETVISLQQPDSS